MGIVPIISGSENDKEHVLAIGDALKEHGIGNNWHAHSAHKEPEDVKFLIEETYQSSRVPIITVAGRSDALSASSAFMSKNPVIASRPDWNDPDSLEMYFFSTIGMPSLVVPGGVLGPVETAIYAKKMLTLKETPPDELSVPYIGKKNEVTNNYVRTIEEIGSGLTTRRSDFSDIGDAPVLVLFRNRSDYDDIDRALSETERPVILCPPNRNKKKIKTSTYRSFKEGYNPAASMVLDSSNLAIYTAKIIGLSDDGIREAVAEYMKV